MVYSAFIAMLMARAAEVAVMIANEGPGSLKTFYHNDPEQLVVQVSSGYLKETSPFDGETNCVEIRVVCYGADLEHSVVREAQLIAEKAFPGVFYEVLDGWNGCKAVVQVALSDIKDGVAA